MALAHEKVGHTDQGLWHHKNMQLPAYIQHVANDLIASGHPESEAVHMAVGLIQKWSRGGGNVTAETQAKAAAALAEWERLKVQAKATRSASVSSSGYDADGLDESWDDPSGLPDLTGLDLGDLGGEQPHPGAQGVSRAGAMALGKGGRFAKLKAALAAKNAKDPEALAAHIGRNKWGKGKFAALAAAAKKRKGGGMATAHRYAGDGAVLPYNEYRRIWDLEDIHIVRTGQGDSTGRLVEAYAAVFGQRAEIHDPQGHYEEENDPGAFNDELGLINRSRNGLASVKAIYNHGLTIHGTPSSVDSIPYGVPKHISPESRGLLTRTLVLNTPRAEEILEAVRAGAITAQSYTGRVFRSDPELPGPGARYRKRGGVLPLVRRMKLGLKEYGLTPFPAFTGAEVLGVRMQLPGGYMDDTADDDFDETDGEEYASANEEDVAGGTPEEVTSPRAQPHSLFASRTHEAGIAPVKGIW